MSECAWYQMDFSKTQLFFMEKDVEFPERYKEIYRGSSQGDYSELEYVNALRTPEESGGCLVPMEERVSYPDKRATEPLERFKAGDGAVWFEHMQKAAGTSFCGWARKNLGYFNVARFECMADGRGRLGSILNPAVTAINPVDAKLLRPGGMSAIMDILNTTFADTPGPHGDKTGALKYTERFKDPREKRNFERDIYKRRNMLDETLGCTYKGKEYPKDKFNKERNVMSCRPNDEIDGNPLEGTKMLANEWDAFPKDFIQPLQDNGIILATILRDPLDRCLSAYNFFHAEHKPEGHPKHQSLMQFRTERGDMNNYYVRKFTEGAMRIPLFLAEETEVWPWQLEEAKDILVQFHFVQILEYLSNYGQEPFEYIGWEFDDSRRNAAVRKRHRSTSKAVAELHQDVIRVLIQENYFDILLYQYAVQLFVERNNGCETL